MPDKATPTVFVSYSHKDEAWKERLLPHLGMLQREGLLQIWEDRKIGYGSEWYSAIQQVMETAAVAICLISADYLASRFCIEEEIPYLLERRSSAGMLLIPVSLRPCAWKRISWLSALQMLPRDGKSVSADFGDDPDTPFSQLAENVAEYLETGVVPDGLRPALPDSSPPKDVDLSRLPITE